MDPKIQPSYETLNSFFSIANIIIGKDIKYIFEFGSRYGEDSIQFAKKFRNATVYSFECNPNTINECRKVTSEFNNIILTEKAVTENDGNISFFTIDKENTVTTWSDGNQGASSLLKASGKYMIEQYAQKEVTVEGISLFTFLNQNKIPQIDLLWMDIQGAELMALRGLKDRIKDVKIIHLEVEFMEIYSDQPLFNEVRSFLENNGFIFCGYTYKEEFSGDAIFINSNIIGNRKKQIEKFLVQESSVIEKNILKRIITKIKKILNL
jgi:FkbM family methyltransferase